VIDFDALYRVESRRVLATLIRLLGDFELAEEALQDAFVAAASQWPRDGVPREVRAWLVSAGRYSAIGRLRRRKRFERVVGELTLQTETESVDVEPAALETDRLRLVFTCCHPALGHDAQLALTLREVCGLSTEQIAAAFLVKPATIAQRIVRAKRKISDERIPYEVPGPGELPDRLELVLHVIYLVFNEGYAASSGPLLTQADLCTEALRLGRDLCELLPEPDAMGLLALLCLQDSRREARTLANGDLVLLADQDRKRWSRALIAEGLALLERAWQPPIGPFTLQAAIAAVHARAEASDATDWGEIVRLYALLERADPSPVVRLNRAVAVGEQRGPAAGLELIEEIIGRGELCDYRHAHAARAEFLRRLGRPREAAAAYRRALELTQQEPEQRFLLRRLGEVEAAC
jgi:RNA polymerase sigma-70 factor (ECF subfamily)